MFYAILYLFSFSFMMLNNRVFFFILILESIILYFLKEIFTCFLVRLYVEIARIFLVAICVFGFRFMS